MLEERDDLLDRVFHAEELAEGRVAPDDAVAEDPGEARVVAGVDQLGLADAGQHPLRGARVGGRVPLAQGEVVLEAHFLVLRGRVIRPEVVEQRRHRVYPIQLISDCRNIKSPPPAADQMAALLVVGSDAVLASPATPLRNGRNPPAVDPRSLSGLGDTSETFPSRRSLDDHCFRACFARCIRRASARFAANARFSCAQCSKSVRGRYARRIWCGSALDRMPLCAE